MSSVRALAILSYIHTISIAIISIWFVLGSNDSHNRRIAKNTLMLYIRMILAMGISLYTSRIVLEQLGVSDFGVFNVVGGIVSMFSVLNSAMASSTQRYLTYELGKNDLSKINIVFNTSLQIHIVIAIVVVLIAETFGLWFLNTEMTIPVNSMNAANWVYQFSVLSMVITFLNVPYTALIIAYEKMSAFAYISILEVLLKLGVAYLLIVSPIEKLKFYAILTFICPLIIRCCYWWYCNRNFIVSKIRMVFDGQLFKEMSSFAGWGLFGQLASMGSTQGVNVLLNIFFGPVVNAARGVAVQVQSAVMQFAMNFQTAVNPQITKNYANSDFQSMHELMYRSAKMSFFLLYALGLPIMIEAPFILNLWLTKVPEYTVPFLRIILWITIIDAVANPLMVAASASGKIKKYQSIIGGLLLSIVPIAYIVLKLGCNPMSVFVVHLIICIIAFISRIYIVAPLTHVIPEIFFKKVVVRCIVVCFLSAIIPYLLYCWLSKEVISNCIIMITSVISVCFFSFYIGLEKSEQSYLINAIATFKRKIV